MNWAIWVVLPLPVSPTRMVVWLLWIILMNSFLACHTGSPASKRVSGAPPLLVLQSSVGLPARSLPLASKAGRTLPVRFCRIW